jgi:hypothetical protein
MDHGMKYIRKYACLTGLLTATYSLPATSDTCMNGYELTAIVVLETNIRHAVSAYACKISSADNQEIYDAYQAVKNKWQKQRTDQYIKRNKVYQRIYGDIWEEKVSEWTNAIAQNESEAFEPSAINCRILKDELERRLSDWDHIYNTAARQAAGPQFDPIRCEPLGLIEPQASPGNVILQQ